jgi:hypothetical protein
MSVKACLSKGLPVAIAIVGFAPAFGQTRPTTSQTDVTIGRVEIATIPFAPNLRISSATYTPSGKVLVSYSDGTAHDPRNVTLAIMNDDGTNMRPFFSQALPERPKANGIRYMVFADNKRVFLGDFIVECAPSLDACAKSSLYPVEYPAEVAGGGKIAFRWSEMIVAPDNRHIAWTTLLANYSAMVFVGELQKTGATYKIVHPRIVSTLDPFHKDPAHADGVLPTPVRGGEVKQFVHGGTAISLVGANRRDTPDSVVQHLNTGRREAITDTPGYTETTIFSPDERLGMTMTTRFSEHTDPAVLGLLPRPYPDSLNMGLSMFAYTYAVTGVREARSGNVGPALIDIEASKTRDGYRGINLNTQDEWVFRSPMSWHPGSAKAMWIEGRRGTEDTRIQIVRLPDYRPGAAVTAKPVPHDIPESSADLSAVSAYASTSQDIHAKVYGRRTGYIDYRRTPRGLIEKTYVDFSDDGQQVYSGSEKMEANPMGRSTYTAKLKLSGPKPGAMDLTMTFGPLRGKLPAQLMFEPGPSGAPLTRGYVEYDGQRLDASSLVP